MIVASFLAEVADVTTEPALNSVFYTAPSAGWFRLSWVVTPIAPLAIGVDGARIFAYIGPPSLDSLQVTWSLTFASGGEGTQANVQSNSTDLYLKAGESLTLQGNYGLNVIVGVRLEQISGGV